MGRQRLAARENYMGNFLSRLRVSVKEMTCPVRIVIKIVLTTILSAGLSLENAIVDQQFNSKIFAFYSKVSAVENLYLDGQR